MIKKNNVLVVIPARSGSKGIKNKNIKIIKGKPLFFHTIDYAKKSKIVDNIILSTDSKKYAKMAERYGLEVPFLRPQNISQDYIQDFYVIKHALVNSENYYKKKFNLIVLLRPTSPFRQHGLIEKSISLLINNINSTSVRSVYKVSEHPYRSWIKKDKFITGFVNDVFEPFNIPRQKLPKIYFQSGDIETIKRKTLFKGSVNGKKVIPLIIKKKSLDIDSKDDLKKIK